MQKFHNNLPGTLLLAYAVYTAFVPVTVAHSIILLSLAILAGFQAFLSSRTQTKHNEQVLRELRAEFESLHNGTKDFYEKRISKVEDEIAKVQLNQLPPKAASSSSPSPRKLVF